jgi:two-component system sensor histidine kinase DesK
MGVLYAGVWLFFHIEPVQDAWALTDPPRRWGGVAATVAFAAVYLSHFVANRRDFGLSLGRQRRATHLVRYAALVLLAAASVVCVGEAGTNTWVFLAVSGLWTWSMRTAYVFAAGLVGLTQVLAWQLPGWDHDLGVVFAIGLAMLAVTGGMYAASRQRDLSAARRENARLAVEEERNRVARDLHDILGHSLTVITVKAELAGRLMDVAPDRARAEVADLEQLSRDALADVRQAVEGFREISLAGELARAREALSAAGIEASVPNATDDVPSDLRELFAWVVREGVTNVVRHSGAQHCRITLDGDGVTVSDDGPGHDDAGAAGVSARQGNGLRGLRERAAAAGARLVARQLEPRGFSLSVIVGPGARAT